MRLMRAYPGFWQLYGCCGSQAAYRYVNSWATAIEREPVVRQTINKPLLPEHQLLLTAVARVVTHRSSLFGHKQSLTIGLAV